MLKKVVTSVLIIILIMFSFYYTAKVSNILKMHDGLMQKIVDIKDDYIVYPINATIEGNNIIPGVVGKEIDIDKTYNNMKRLGNFNKSLIIYKDILPAITINSNYDKYIIKGNKNINHVSFIFRLNNINYLTQLLKILEDNEVRGIFVVNNNFIFNDIETVVQIINDKHLITSIYSEDYIQNINMLNSIDNHLKYYCVTPTDNQELLDICHENKLNTIKPNIIINKYPYFEIKNQVDNGSIIYFEVNVKLLKELDPIIKYLKQRGFDIVRIDDIISEVN